MIGGSHEADIEQGMIDGSVADFGSVKSFL